MTFANYQYEIYLAGLGGDLPALPFLFSDLEARAKDVLTPGAHGYVAGGASSEDTMRANLQAFTRRRIVPRMLRDTSARDLSVEVFGATLPAPVMLAPIGVQSIVHPDGELATARAAAQLGMPMVVSTASSYSMEEIAAAAGDAPRWYQLYWPRDPDLADSFVGRAEAAGYGAIVVTLDTPILAWRPRDLREAYLPFLRGEGVANYFSDPVFRAALAKPPEEDLQMAVAHFSTLFGNPALTWESLAWLRQRTTLPIVLKGILHADDARRAIDAGVDGVVVSNHGGRQVDGAIASLDALPSVVEAAGDQLTVLLDSGIRTGSDVFKALALGARAVLLGRPYMWGLALAGATGVRDVVRAFLADLDLTFALSGYTRPGELDPDCLQRS